MGEAPLEIEKAREERINSNTERMKQLGIHTLSRDVNSPSNKKKKDPTRKRRVERSSEQRGVVGEGCSPKDIEEYNPSTSCDESSSEEEAPQKKKKKKNQEQGVLGEGSSHQNQSGANPEMGIELYNPLSSSDESSGEEEEPQKKTRERHTTKGQLGGLEVSGSSDVLTLSLGNPEHPGRTRGLGAHVTWKQGLNTYRASRKRGFNQAEMKDFAEEIQRQCYANMREEMKEEMRQQMKEEMKEQFSEQVRDMRFEILAEFKMQQAVPDQNSSGFRRSSQHSNAVTTSPLDSILVISPCYLTCKVGEEHIKMANARVWPWKKDESVHCVPLLEDHMKGRWIRVLTICTSSFLSN